LVQKSDLYIGSLPSTASGYYLREALFTNEKLRLGTESESTYPTNSYDGTFKQIIWKSVDAQYYRFPFDTCATLEHSNERFSSKFLNYSASIISLPYMDYGEIVRPGSVEITGSNFNLTDDANGNLYDVSLTTGSYSDRHNLIAYWGFNNEFRRNKTVPEFLEKTKIDYYSSQFEDTEGSVAKNIKFENGVALSSTSSGTSARFDQSYILTPNRDEFNFSKVDDFTIAFWAAYETGSNGTEAILISKKDILTTQVYGELDKPNQNGLIVPTFHVSTSTEYSPTDVYPYKFYISSGSGTINFKRSDGTKIIHLSGSLNLNDNKWHHFSSVKSGSNLYLYQDGTLLQSGSEVNYHPLNKHSLMFGSDNFNFQNSFLGRMDEIRIYNKGLTQTTIQTLADSSSLGMYQSSIVGNVFYRSGNIVVSSLNPKYNQILNQDWKLRYRGTHVIYEYECLVRIKKSFANLTLNPTALIAPNSDLLINDFTSSIDEFSLTPYCTEIGLYSDKRELVAVAKLNQPLKMRDDVDINILIKFHA